MKLKKSLVPLSNFVRLGFLAKFIQGPVGFTPGKSAKMKYLCQNINNTSKLQGQVAAQTALHLDLEAMYGQDCTHTTRRENFLQTRAQNPRLWREFLTE